MDAMYTLWPFGLAVFAAGGVIGAILYRLFAPAAKNTADLKARLEESERALEDYRAKITDHFNETSNLVNQLTRDYVKVYKHLSEGAQSLGDPERASRMLEQQNETLVPIAEESIGPASQELIEEAVREAAKAVRENSGEPSDAEPVQSDSTDDAGGAATRARAQPGPEAGSGVKPEARRGAPGGGAGQSGGDRDTG